MLAFLAVGGFWFWTLLALSTIFIVASLEGDKARWATVTVAAVFALLWFFGDFNVISYVWNNPARTAIGAAIYLGCGALWSMIKWAFYILNRKDLYKEKRTSYLDGLGLAETDEIPEDEKQKFFSSLNQSYNWHDSESLHQRPKASKHKKRISTWVAYWPWSLCWSLIGDVLKRAANWTFTLFHDLYEKISKSLYQSVEKDLPEDKIINKSKAA